MPRVRIKDDRNRIYGSMRLGGLAELFLTDQRQYRDPQPCMDALLTPCPDTTNPGRKMLGDTQKEWFKSALPASSATWKLWGSEVMLMAVEAPKGQPAILDSWDGYEAERQEILEHFVSQRRQEPRGDHRRHPHVLRRRPVDDGRRSGHADRRRAGRRVGDVVRDIPEELGIPSAHAAGAGRGERPARQVRGLRSAAATPSSSLGRQAGLRVQVGRVDVEGAKPEPLKTIEVDNGVPAVRVL